MAAPSGTDWIRKRAGELGFCECRFAPAELDALTAERLARAIADGHHATMTWLADTAPRRAQPRAMWAAARSAIVLAMNYGPDADPLANLSCRDRATVSVYARNRDYHDVMKGRLKILAGQIAARLHAEVKVFVDTAPLMEKPLAQIAGIGWQGKHTNLVSRRFGSWLFLGAILTDAVLPVDAPEADHCGQCRACIDICPTGALPAPRRLDARRCISYLTIEHDGPIPRRFRKAMGNRVFGCDDCLAVCPFNKFARLATEAKLAARKELESPPLDFLASLDESSFRRFFAGSPVKRSGRARFLRNVAIAIGNSGQTALAASAKRLLAEESPQVRGAAIWALRMLLGEDAMRYRDPRETDSAAIAEWGEALE